MARLRATGALKRTAYGLDRLRESDAPHAFLLKGLGVRFRVYVLGFKIYGSWSRCAPADGPPLHTRHQLNLQANESIAKSIRSLLREGGVRRLYRGLLPELVGMTPTRSAMVCIWCVCVVRCVCDVVCMCVWALPLTQMHT